MSVVSVGGADDDEKLTEHVRVVVLCGVGVGGVRGRMLLG